MKKVTVDNVFSISKVWEDVRCPFGHSTKSLNRIHNIASWEYKGVYEIYKCKVCDMCFQNPRVKEKHVGIYYESMNYWGCDIDNLITDDDYKEIRSKKYDDIYNNVDMGSSGRVLDVGCGTGILLSKFEESGWDTFGVDISESAVNYAKKVFNIAATTGDINSYKNKGGKLDLITMTHVLEHVYNPKKDLTKAKGLLKKGGELIIIIPNIDSLGYIIFKEKWYQFHPGRHLYYFSPNTIKKILRETGFEVEDIKHTGWEDNYYSQFLSLRNRFSPKFNNSKDKSVDPRKPLDKSFIYEVKKLVSKIVAGVLTATSFLINKSDVITIYAKKT